MHFIYFVISIYPRVLHVSSPTFCLVYLWRIGKNGEFTKEIVGPSWSISRRVCRRLLSLTCFWRLEEHAKIRRYIWRERESLVWTACPKTTRISRAITIFFRFLVHFWSWSRETQHDQKPQLRIFMTCRENNNKFIRHASRNPIFQSKPVLERVLEQNTFFVLSTSCRFFLLSHNQQFVYQLVAKHTGLLFLILNLKKCNNSIGIRNFGFLCCVKICQRLEERQVFRMRDAIESSCCPLLSLQGPKSTFLSSLTSFFLLFFHALFLFFLESQKIFTSFLVGFFQRLLER